MPFLAIDSATAAVTVAVADESGVLALETREGGLRHGELLAPALAAVLERSGVRRTELTSVFVGTGPGPYTGLRVGLVTARVLGTALGIPVRGVSTLDVLAFAAVAEGVTGSFRVVTDARRKEVYWAEYDGLLSTEQRQRGSGGAAGLLRHVSGPAVDRPSDVAWDGPAVGAGALMYAEHFPGHRPPTLPSAGALAGHVLAGLPTTEPSPLYLRRPDIAAPTGRKPALA